MVTVRPELLEEVIEDLSQDELALLKDAANRVDLWRLLKDRYPGLGGVGAKKVLDALVELNGGL